MKSHKAINRTSVSLLTIHMFLYPLCISPYIHMVIGHMEALKAINRTSAELLTMHMFLYPYGVRSYEGI